MSNRIFGAGKSVRLFEIVDFGARIIMKIDEIFSVNLFTLINISLTADYLSCVFDWINVYRSMCI